jgi:serine/threonine protein kinase
MHVVLSIGRALYSLACHSNNAISVSDVKPSNILLNCDCSVKIADFGLTRSMCDTGQTKYVVTRFYRAPEIMLGCSSYDTAIDVWGAGCTFAELLTGEVLFRGSSYTDMVPTFLVVGQNRPSPFSFGSFIESFLL